MAMIRLLLLLLHGDSLLLGRVNLLLASAFARRRWIASMTSACCAITASPSFCVQSSLVLIISSNGRRCDQ